MTAQSNAAQRIPSADRDVFFLREIPGRRIKAGYFAAATASVCFFISENKLYSLHKEILRNTECALDDAEQIPAPPGEVVALMALENDLYIIVRNDSQTDLHVRAEEGTWHPIPTPHPMKKIHRAWCLSEDGRWLFFYESKSGAGELSTIYAIGKDRVPFAVANLRPPGLSCAVTQRKGWLLFSSAQTKEIFSLRIFNDREQFLSCEQIRYKGFSVIPLKASPYLLLPAKRKGLLFTRHGSTAIFDEQEGFVFADAEIGRSGCHGTAGGMLTGRHEYHFLGSLRRYADNPYACFYILKNRHCIHKHMDAVPLQRGFEGTGFFTYDGSFSIKNDAFIPCFASSAVYICKLDSTSDIQTAMKHTVILHEDEETLLLGKLETGILPPFESGKHDGERA